MNLYADTSGLATIILNEPRAGELRAAAEEADRISSVQLAYVELRAAVARAGAMGRYRAEARETYRVAVDTLWAAINELAVQRDLLWRAAGLAELFVLRGYDAVHLAGLQESGDPGDITFLCLDVALRRAASGLGYELLPKSL